jgi:hypothetical protein
MGPSTAFPSSSRETELAYEVLPASVQLQVTVLVVLQVLVQLQAQLVVLVQLLVLVEPPMAWSSSGTS